MWHFISLFETISETSQSSVVKVIYEGLLVRSCLEPAACTSPTLVFVIATDGASRTGVVYILILYLRGPEKD